MAVPNLHPSGSGLGMTILATLRTNPFQNPPYGLQSNDANGIPLSGGVDIIPGLPWPIPITSKPNLLGVIPNEGDKSQFPNGTNSYPLGISVKQYVTAWLTAQSWKINTPWGPPDTAGTDIANMRQLFNSEQGSYPATNGDSNPVPYAQESLAYPLCYGASFGATYNTDTQQSYVSFFFSPYSDYASDPQPNPSPILVLSNGNGKIYPFIDTEFRDITTFSITSYKPTGGSAIGTFKWLDGSCTLYSGNIPPIPDAMGTFELVINSTSWP